MTQYKNFVILSNKQGGIMIETKEIFNCNPKNRVSIREHTWQVTSCYHPKEDKIFIFKVCVLCNEVEDI